MNSTIILKKMLKLYEIWNSVYEKKINNNSIEILNQDYQKNLQYSLIQDNAVNSFKKILKYLNPYEKQIMKNIVNTFGFIVRKESDGVYRPAAFND